MVIENSVMTMEIKSNLQLNKKSLAVGSGGEMD